MIRKYEQLSDDEKSRACEKCLIEIIACFIEGDIEIQGEHKYLQKKIDNAVRRAEELRTPWFAHEYILEDPEVKAALLELSVEQAKDALYPELDDIVIHLE